MSDESITGAPSEEVKLSQPELAKEAVKLIESYKASLKGSRELAEALSDIYFDDSQAAAIDYGNRKVTFPRGTWVYEIKYDNSSQHRRLEVWRNPPANKEYDESIILEVHKDHDGQIDLVAIQYRRFLEPEVPIIYTNTQKAVEKAQELLIDFKNRR